MSIDDLVVEVLEDARLRRAKLLPEQREAVEYALRSAFERERIRKDRDDDWQRYVTEEKGIIPLRLL